jgi:uncharacterized coiled-coil protein SlyX
MVISRPVVAFALLRQCSEIMRTDLLSGIAVLIRPLISDLADQLFDSRVLSERLANAYGVSIPSAALEGMTHRLVAADVLRIEQGETGLTRALYTKNQDIASFEPDSEADFQTILDEFLRHAKNRLISADKGMTEEALTTGFLRHLATLDFSAIKVRPVVLPEQGSTIVGPAAREQIALSAELADQAMLDSLVASYIAWLQEHQPARLSLLAKVADGALAAELVFDLQAPTSVSRLTNTTVVVDTPLILSYLDLSSSRDTLAAKKLIEQILETGAKVAAYKHSIEEAEGILKAIQTARGAGDAYGPSVYRLSNSTFRAYFDSMIGAVSKVWTQKHKFEVIPEAATHFHKNFTQIDEEEATAAIRLNMYDRVLTRERDAKSVAETMRRLGGAHIPVSSIVSCQYIFATSNSSLQRRVSDFLASKKFVLEGDFNPIVTSRYLSGLCWLICGGKSDQSPTMARLLANCAAALRVKPEIAERTKRFLADVDPEKAIHFEALMTNERASQYLIEVTLGDVNVITANNVEDIYEEVQRRAAEKVAIEKDHEYQGQIRVLESMLLEGEKTVERLESSLIETQSEIETRKIEVHNLSQRSDELQRNYSESLEKISDQERLLASLNAKATEASDAVSKVHNMLEQQWDRGRAVARRHADRRTRQIRWTGIALLFILAFGSGYIDKFVAPFLSAENQPKANLAIICLQTILAMSGLASIFDPLVRKPLERLHHSLYKSRLAELGIPDAQNG